MENQRALALSEQQYPIHTTEDQIIEQELCSADSPIASSERCHEDQLILACTRTVVNAETVERIKELIGKGIDWSYLIRTASRNGVMPLVCLNIINLCPSLLPVKVLMDCSEFWRDHAQDNLFQTARLLSILRLLESNHIPALPLKGPTLAAYAYHNLSLRQFCDLDILVSQGDIAKSLNLLSKNGFRLSSSPTWLQRLPTPGSRKKDYGLTSEDGHTRVELHWRLSGPHFDLPLDLEDMWERLETLRLAGSSVRNLPLDEMLLYLTLHGSRHGWERLLFICDIAEIIRSYDEEIDWGRLVAKASVLGSKRSLILGLHLANDLLNASLPVVIQDEINADPAVRQLAAQVRTLLFRVDESGPSMSYWQSYHLKVKERLRERLRLRMHYSLRYLRLVVRPTALDRTGLSLRAHLSFLSYFTRPFRLIGVYGSGILARTFHQKKKP